MFSETMKKRRMELGLTQQEVADRLFVTRQTISNWENGKNFPDIPMLVTISDSFDLSLDYLLKGDERYLKKIEADYDQIAEKKQTRQLGHSVAALTIAIVLVAVIGGIFFPRSADKWIGLSVLTLCIPLEILSYFLYKSFYQQPENATSSIWVPKMYGFGLSVNPNTAIGKAVWVIVFFGLMGLWFYGFLFQ